MELPTRTYAVLLTHAVSATLAVDATGLTQAQQVALEQAPPLTNAGHLRIEPDGEWEVSAVALDGEEIWTRCDEHDEITIEDFGELSDQFDGAQGAIDRVYEYLSSHQGSPDVQVQAVLADIRALLDDA
ncbi:hypothetical protein K1T35_47540 (plasmid) [Pseudonocardia sp. DSM 110487]|uniref:hypothetical protein n=1 Tax=Pseudonocardia sp. DSM 110487 TaxID=2865833 RepID=UPI001C694F78|nr:hypothetical protein [Pseudonocardia sp. DSM 110487]QYN41004.1 hypothetical protein K1T35_47540 [Pseudonocardia sp. DSM 110487]